VLGVLTINTVAPRAVRSSIWGVWILKILEKSKDLWMSMT